MTKCKICSDPELREMIDLYLKLGYSYSWILNKFNPKLKKEKQPLLNSKDLSLYKRLHLIPSLTDDDLDALADLSITLINGNFINPALLNKTLYKKDT